MNQVHLQGQSRLRNVARFLLVGVWFVIVTYLSLVSGDSLKGSWMVSIPYRDKLFHFGAYFVASFLMMYAWSGSVKKTFRDGVMYTIMVSVIWGGVIEYLQKAISTGRHFEFFDIIANIIGALVGVAMFKLFFKKRYYGS